MDSRKDTTSKKNSLKCDCDSEKNRNCRGTQRQSESNNDAENVITTSNQSSNCVPLNGPRRHFNSLSNYECIQQSSRSNENSTDVLKHVSSSQPLVCTRVNNSHIEPIQVASCSSVHVDTYSNNAEPKQGLQCTRLKSCLDKVNNAPSTSGSSKSCDNSDNVGFRENRKRPSSLKLNRPNLDADDSSSDTGNDDYSLGSEDGCIYTYRGGEHLADLPSSFFSLDMGLPLDRHLPIPPNYAAPQQGAPNVRDQGSRASSPDMDFLEMDFDPGPSCEADTGDESTPDAELDAVSNMPEENEPVLRNSPDFSTGPRYIPVSIPAPVASSSHTDDVYHSMPSTSQAASIPVISGTPESKSIYGLYITHLNARGEQIIVRRTMSHCPQQSYNGLHMSNGDLVSPRETLNYVEDQAEGPLAHQINQSEKSSSDSVNLSSALYHITMAKKLMVEKTRSDIEAHDGTIAGDSPMEETGESSTGVGSGREVPRCMVWSEREASERQVTQIGTSACGATAVVNAFVALGVPVNLERINTSVGTRQRANNAPLPRYLLSRAVAGCTANDLVNGLQRASDGLVTARFFPTYPERAVSLSHWLADWITLGAVPILTLNLQMSNESEIPDAWHHQMVFGVSSRGVYLCNPVECVRESALWPQLTSPSVLLVRTRDVLTRFTANTDLTPLMVVPDQRFQTFNVLGQVVNSIREWRATGWSEHGTRTRHIRIPASYQGGITVAALTGSEAQRRLVRAAQLPHLTHSHPA